MAPIDDVKSWIIKMFEMEENEGRDSDCQRFPRGQIFDDLPLDTNELVYGIYKEKYFFTPQSIIIKNHKKTEKIFWNMITRCSSRHGEGKVYSELQLSDGGSTKVRVGDLATGWSGRISQLFHQMIERHGNKAGLGIPLFSIDEFFERTDRDDCFAPNLYPHPGNEKIIKYLKWLESQKEVAQLYIDVVDIEGGTPVSDGVIIVAQTKYDLFKDFASNLSGEVMKASQNTINKIPKEYPKDLDVLKIVFD